MAPQYVPGSGEAAAFHALSSDWAAPEGPGKKKPQLRAQPGFERSPVWPGRKRGAEGARHRTNPGRAIRFPGFRENF